MQAQIRLLETACQQDHDNILQFCGMYEDQGEVIFCGTCSSEGHIETKYVQL